MTSQEIEKEINDEFSKFYNSKYGGALPQDLIELFKKALMKTPINQLHTSKARLMMDKKPSELTVMEVGLVINKILEVPFEFLYKNLTEALTKHEALEKVVVDYNIAKHQKEAELTQKKRTYYELSGKSGGSRMNIVN